jgi:glycosyltransferase involved in cell wall biosynthesis
MGRRPRYAIIGSRGYPSTYGGFETLVRRLAPFLAEQGADVTVYGRSAGLRPWSVRVEDVRVVHTPGIDGTFCSTLSYGFTSMAHARRVGYDAALVVNVANGFWLPMLRAAGIPSLVNVDGIEWERGKWNGLGKKVFKLGARATARMADRIVVDSHAVGDYWRDEFGVSSHFIPYGADVLHDDASDRVRALGLQPGSYLLVVARLVPENNVELFVDALEHLRAEVPVVVVGTAAARSPLEARLEQLERTRGSFRWLGHVDDQLLLGQLWRHCALYVHGHSVGGTNPSLLSALGAGAPTLALETVYNREVLGRGWPTYLLDRQQELARRIEEQLADPPGRRFLAARGQAIVRSRYRWDDVLGRYATALADLAGTVARRRDLAA